MVQPRSGKNKGYIILISILIIGAVGTAIAVSVLLLGIAQARTSLTLDQSNEAMGLADACSEDALWQIRNDDTFTGAISYDYGDERTCDYTVANTGGENRTIQTTAQVKDVTRKSEILISQIDPEIIVDSWLDVGDF